MTDESVEERCQCGRPATVPHAKYALAQCMICHLVDRFGTGPRRKYPGNIGDGEIEVWMRRQLRKAFEEMVSLMRKDLDDLAERWNPPGEDSTEHGNQP